MYICHQCGKDNTMKNGGWLSKYNTPEAQNGIEGTMAGLTDKGFNYNGAWGGTMAMGGSLPGSVGFTYARTQDPAPSNGPYAKKTKASAQNGQEMKFYQEGLDWKPKNISRDGSSLPKAQSGTQLSTEDQAIIQDRKNRIKASVAARENGNYTKDNWRQQLADESQAIGDKFRIFPDDPNSIIDEYFNPAVTIGSMAADLGSAPLRAQQEDSYLPYASAIATPLVIGALEGFGVKSNKQFAKNIINPFNFPGQGYVKNVLGKTANKVSKAAGNFAQDFSKGYKSVPTREDGGWLSKYQEGGIIEDDRGQWEYPGEITKINSNEITMQGVDYPVLGISDTGDTQMMQPGQDYTYDGESVTEIPMMPDGGKVKRFLNEAKNSIIKGGGNPFSIANNLIEPSVDLLASTLAPHETIKEREALFNKYRPVEYPNPINITRGLLYPEEQGSPRRDMEGNYDIGEEAWRKALDLPVKENYIIPSQYKPTDAKNPKAKYYTLNDIIDSDKIITEAKKLGWKPGASYNVGSLAPFIKKGAVIDEEDFGNVDPLQQFQLDIDPEGKYASIYDKYDFKYSSLNKIIKPYEFYDRFYLPEKKVSKGKKEDGGWLSKYN
jgi:hypothetical protein